MIEYRPWPDDGAILCGYVTSVGLDEVTIKEIDANGMQSEVEDETYDISDIHEVTLRSPYLVRLQHLVNAPLLGGLDTSSLLQSQEEKLQQAAEGDRAITISFPSEAETGEDEEPDPSTEYQYAVRKVEWPFIEAEQLDDNGESYEWKVIRATRTQIGRAGNSDAQVTQLLQSQKRANTIFADEDLFVRLERFLAQIGRQGAALFGPDHFLDLGHGYAVFAGVGCPITQAHGRFSAEDIDQISSFYAERGTGWEAIVTPFAEPGAVDRLQQIGAQLNGWETVLFLPLPHLNITGARLLPEVSIQEVGEDRVHEWAQLLQSGFEDPSLNSALANLNRYMTELPGMHRYLLSTRGSTAAAAGLIIRDDIAYLAGSATREEFRGQGFHGALLDRRVQVAMRHGARLAIIGTEPGSISQRNAERAGFRVAYNVLSFSVPAKS